MIWEDPVWDFGCVVVNVDLGANGAYFQEVLEASFISKGGEEAREGLDGVWFDLAWGSR